ncbi:MAG TPA: hypothetical protein VGE22_06700 [Solimonas sp.]
MEKAKFAPHRSALSNTAAISSISAKFPTFEFIFGTVNHRISNLLGFRIASDLVLMGSILR